MVRFQPAAPERHGRGARLPDLRYQYAYVRRDWVLAGHMARQWRQKERAAIKLLPVLALLVRGYDDQAAYLQHSVLRELAGLTPRRLQSALIHLGASAEVRLLASGRADVEHVTVTDAFLARGRRPGFCFPGWVAWSGVWADLEDSDCAILLAVAALSESHFCEFTGLPEEIFNWMDELEACYHSEATHSHCAPRVCRASVSELMDLTGLNKGNVSRRLAHLCDVCDGDLLKRQADADGAHWYHLPSAFWAPPKEVAAQ